ncbi:MAG TPA: ABC transporter ATP-binding protein [Devosiaceae bacterium]|nr:ABC transporter ATP-binding protein [Devosiaceae bacterium]
MTDLVGVENLTVGFKTAEGGRFTAVNGLSFAMGAEKLGIVGESGSGKTMTALTLAGLAPQAAEITADRLEVAGEDLRRFKARDWPKFRGSVVGLIMQDPRSALNPSLIVGRQVEEALRFHPRFGRSERRDRVLSALEAVGLPNPKTLAGLYPHQLSGGMGQRVMIATALVNEPKLLIADEPTSALDEALREQVLELLVSLVESRGMGLILISHDLVQVARHCDRALVMYRGRLVDQGRAADLPNSTHPYTATLWACRPSAATHGQLLPTLDRTVIEASL